MVLFLEEYYNWIIAASAAILFFLSVKSSYYFRFWYGLNNRFANLRDIKQIGLFDGFIMALGQVTGKKIALAKPFSVFCFGKKSYGKTLGVAIPSIISSDASNIVAADTKGLLHKYTSGYRKTAGRVFYFDWKALDNYARGEIYPRWNPLSPKNLPHRGFARDEYLAKIARNVFPENNGDYWAGLVGMAMEGLLNCFTAKVEHAYANDYFLKKLMAKEPFSKEDKDILISYYLAMPKRYSTPAIMNVRKGTLNVDNYLPVGSWLEIPSAWQGKELCLAFCADCLMQRYFMVIENEDVDGWKIVLAGFMKEAKFFGYHEKSLRTLEHLFYLPRKQRKVLFTIILDALKVFRDKAIRERTSVSDFSNAEIRGMEGKPITIYAKADDDASRFMTRFMIDMLVETNLDKNAENNVLVVLDDFDLLPKFYALEEGLKRGFYCDMSFLLLSKDLKKTEEIYGRKVSEAIVHDASYKLLLAETSKQLGEQLINLADLANKSVQLPMTQHGLVSFSTAFSDADYYRKVARRLIKADFGIKNLLLAEGYYHLPISVEPIYFQKNPEMGMKTNMEPYFALYEDLFAKRDEQDLQTALLENVLKEVGVSLHDEERIEAYIRNKYQEADIVTREEHNKEDVFSNDLSMRWDASRKKKAVSDEEWWLSEEAFETKNVSDKSPFSQ